MWADLGAVKQTTHTFRDSQGVGYGIVQSQLLISGLWGALYYREIVGKQAIMRWLSFALLTILGMVVLSLERGHTALAHHLL